MDKIIPQLPGNSFNDNIGKTKFHRSQLFKRVRGCPMPTDEEKAGIGNVPLDCVKISDKYPSVYPKGESALIPAWIPYDRKVLCFDAYFQETAQERNGYAHQVRICKIFFHLEDGTIQVSEPRLRNSGILQGPIISRKRIPFPEPRHREFYDILDFNIGHTVEFYGRIFKITNCDRFTRTFLNRLGISVPDPIPMPKDPYMDKRDKEADDMAPRNPNIFADTRGQFLRRDRHVLRFCAYWDNRDQPYGLLHHLALHYFLADDTIEVTEIIPPNSGRDVKSIFLKRGKLPKHNPGLPGLGNPGFTVLNVIPTGFLRGRFIPDPLNVGQEKVEFYKDRDLAIGASINCYGRNVVLTDCDPFTKEHYRQTYGIEDFTPAPKPYEPPECVPFPLPPLPPYNGWGSYEDSAGNCRKMVPERPKLDFIKFFEKDKLGMDSHCLRFQARMISHIPENNDRLFIVSFFLSDDTISVAERVCPNSGFQGGTFYRRMKMYKPGQEIFASEEPDHYKVEDMFVGNHLHLNEHEFVLVDADEYALRYLERHGSDFPKNDVTQVIDKLKTLVFKEPSFKDVLSKFTEKKEDCKEDPKGIVSYCEMRKILKDTFGEEITEQEMITIARKYNACCKKGKMDSESLRSIVHTELKRFLFYDLDRLHESFCELDRSRTGFVERNQAYALCRAARIPVDRALLNAMLDAMPQNESHHISYPDFVQFLDYKKHPCFHSVPINQKITFGANDPSPEAPVGFVDLQLLFKDLGVDVAVNECT